MRHLWENYSDSCITIETQNKRQSKEHQNGYRLILKPTNEAIIEIKHVVLPNLQNYSGTKTMELFSIIPLKHLKNHLVNPFGGARPKSRVVTNNWCTQHIRSRKRLQNID